MAAPQEAWCVLVENISLQVFNTLQISVKNCIIVKPNTKTHLTMINSLQRIVTGKMILILLAFASVTFVASSCGPKHACGTMHQKKQRNKRIKHNTNFMTY
jgi:hypothetical protein